MQNTTPNTATNTLLDVMIDQVMTEVYAVRPSLRKLEGRDYELWFLLYKDTMLENGTRLVDGMSEMYEGATKDGLTETELKLEFSDRCGRLARQLVGMWNKFTSLRDPNKNAVHTLARAKVYTQSAELDESEQAPIIMQTLERLRELDQRHFR